MRKAIVTGSYGLIGSQASKFLHEIGFSVLGVDDESRSSFFGPSAASVAKSKLSKMNGYRHSSSSILDLASMEAVVREQKPDLVIHAAGQPSHDWASDHPFEDFDANARGTLNMLHAVKKHAPDAVFVFTSTNKVYGDRPNSVTEYEEKETRWEPLEKEYSSHGFGESLSVDQCKHSLFGVSKLYADMIVQEYGRYFGMRTGVFRFGCVTGPSHAGVEQHGFLSYLFKCLQNGTKYNIYGYKGKQVRDNIHAFDAVTALYEFYKNPKPGEVYNMGGSFASNCSILEAIKTIELISDKKIETEYFENARSGDHIWYVSDIRKFKGHYPDWHHSYTLSTIIEEMLESKEKL